MLKTSEIEAIMASEPNDEAAVSALFEATMAAGGVDNITIAVVVITRLDE